MYKFNSISRQHKNKKAHNFLYYYQVDKLIIKNTNLFNGKLVDLGSGTSPYRDFFELYCSSYTSVDWSNSPHEIKADVISDLNVSINVVSNSVDVVVSISVLEHLYRPQIMLKETYRILKDGGNLMMHVPWQWWVHEAPHDYYRYSPYGLEYLLSDAGFKLIRIEPQGGVFSSIFFKLNYYLKRFSKGPRVLKLFIDLILLPILILNQFMAFMLDKLDFSWSLESPGYIVTAKK